MRKKRILIFGNGYIGKRLAEGLNCNLSERRIYQTKDILEEVKKYKANIIINCIGYVGYDNVGDCETLQRKTLITNCTVPLMFAEAAVRTGVKVVHISSGCMYEYNYKKNKPIQESKKPDYFKLYYSRTKIYSEGALSTLIPDYNILITRIRIPLDDRPSRKNILDKLIKYKKVIDIPNSITYIPDFIEMVKHLIKVNARGIYNTVNKGKLYYKDLLDEYKCHKYDFDYKLIKLRQLKLNRTTMIMSTKKLENTGFKVRHIKDVITECVENYIENNLDYTLR